MVLRSGMPESARNFIISGYGSLGTRHQPPHGSARYAGRFAFALDQIVPTLQGLRESLTGPGRRHSAVETAILSTCNRTEIYCAAETPALDHTVHWLAHSGGISSELLRSHSYLLEDGHVARHAFRVASGLTPWCWARPRSWAR